MGGQADRGQGGCGRGNSDMIERTAEYSSPEARAHEPSVAIADGYASMLAEQWVAYANLSNGFFQALLEIANTFEIDWHEAQQIAREALPSSEPR